MTLEELTNGLSKKVLELSITPDLVPVLSFGQELYELISTLKIDIAKIDQIIEEHEGAIVVAIASDNNLSNDFKRKAAKLALCAEDAALMVAEEQRAVLEQRLAAAEFLFSQYQVLTRMLPKH